MNNKVINILDKVIVIELNIENKTIEPIYVGEVTTIINNKNNSSVFLNCVEDKENTRLYFADIFLYKPNFGLAITHKDKNTKTRHILPINYDIANCDIFNRFEHNKTEFNDMVNTFVSCYDNKHIKQKHNDKKIVLDKDNNTLSNTIKNKLIALFNLNIGNYTN